jgi:nitrilase
LLGPVLGPDGALIAKHRKLMPTASERLVWAQGDGSTLPAIDTPMGTVGSAICWENYMPLLRQAMYDKGVDIWCTPTVDEREIWQASMRHIAYEGRMFLLSACQFMTRADAPDDYAAFADVAPETQIIKGGSMIVSPMGEIWPVPCAGPRAFWPPPSIWMMVRARYDLDVAGHYARPDVFSLSVDTQAKRERQR